MILENSDKLKDWLSVVLEPLCDADSSALARYVIALLKKDKSDKDLKRIMIEQLDVFLSEETTQFVDRLFDAIASEEYLTMPAPMPVATAAVPELELDHDLDGVADIEAVLAAATSPPPPPPPKDIVINADGNQQEQQQQQINNNNNTSSSSSVREMSSEILPHCSIQSIAGSGNVATATDANLTVTQSIKPALDHKTKDTQSSSGMQQQQLSHHPHISGAGFVRSASPPMRSVGSGIGISIAAAAAAAAVGGAYAAAAAADKENQPRDSRRRRASLRSRSRSRSRSNERSFRRSRSRDRRINEREKTQRQFRNKSPPGGTSEQRHRRNNNTNSNNFDRRRIGNNNNSNSNNSSGNNNNNNMDERNQRFAGGNKGRHSPRSRSISPETRNTRRGNNLEPAACSSSSVAVGLGVGPAVAIPLPVVHPVAAMARQRCRDFDEKGYCVRGETCPWDHGINPVVFEGINNSALMMSMREYNPDAPEIWARGGPAGSVPGVIEAGGGNQQSLSVGPPGQQGQGPNSINPFSGNVRACAPLGVPNPADYARNPGQGPPPSGPPPMMPFPFNPTAVTTPLQRQLIPIPVMDGGAGSGCVQGGGVPGDMGKRRFELEDSVAIADVPSKMRKVPINSRLGPRVNPNMQQHNSSLELRKVPRGLNTIAHLNNHFAKFGKIVNIQVSYEGDPEAAIVTFSTHAEANVAYRSTEAVLNNRFIKVFWHNDNNSSGGGNSSGNNNNDMGTVNVNRKSQYHLHNVPAVPTPNADSAKITNSQTATPLAEAGSGNNNSSNNSSSNNTALTATTADQLASTAAPASMRLKLNTNAASNNVANGGAAGGATRALTPAANAASIRKKQEEQQKAMHQLANGLRKRKQELLQSYVKQMKTALELVERMDQQDVQRAPTLETIKVLQATIDKLRKDVHADQDQLQAQMQQQQQQQQQQALPPKRTKEQQKKELLDMELELIAQQQDGNDTSAIQKRLEELQRTLSATGGGSNNMSGVKLPGGGARKRATYPEGSTRVDRRPKAIVVTGFAAEEADFVLGHFKHFGEISKHDVDREIPQLILSYATRLNAEQAVVRGKMYKDKRLQISWAPVVTTTAAVAMGAPADKSTASLPLDKLDNPKQLMQSVSESESLLGSDILPELRLEDEEEDEESEDRSWRR